MENRRSEASLTEEQMQTLLLQLSGSDGSGQAAPEDAADDATAKDSEYDEEEDSCDEEEEFYDSPDEMTPAQVVESLEKHVVGQPKAKRAIAVALRNRWRRKQLEPEHQQEIAPRNLLMIGPSGVGKTELARRLAKLVDAPFVKVEATKYTEVGFHGKDVDSIIRNLVEVAITKTKERKRKMISKKIKRMTENRILKALVGSVHTKKSEWRTHLRAGALENQIIEIEVPVKEPDVANLQPQANALMLRAVSGKSTEKRKMSIKDARPIIEDMEAEKLLTDVVDDALKAAEDGIVFIDEIDKICTSSKSTHHADASAEGVQRDLLPLVEGCQISTKHGNLNTDHILFIASGAFLSVTPEDMMPELQGRLPIRIQLDALTQSDFYRILTEPELNIIKQQQLLMGTEGLNLILNEECLREIARVSFEVNRHAENIGARRLHAVVESVVEKISFDASDIEDKDYNVTLEMVQEATKDMMKKTELANYVM